MKKKQQTVNGAGMPNRYEDNVTRADRAGVVLVNYQNVTGGELEEGVGDLLADLMHWCDLNGVDFEGKLHLGRLHYDDETGR